MRSSVPGKYGIGTSESHFSECRIHDYVLWITNGVNSLNGMNEARWSTLSDGGEFW